MTSPSIGPQRGDGADASRLEDVALSIGCANDLEPADDARGDSGGAPGREVSIIWLLKDECMTFYRPSNPEVSTMSPVTASWLRWCHV